MRCSCIPLLAVLLAQTAYAAFCFDSAGKPVADAASSSVKGCIVTQDLASGQVEFTLFSAARGWFGFGVSSLSDTQQMGPADVVVAFNDQSGVAQARSFLTGPSPAIQANPARVWTKTDLNGTAPAWATIAISVTRSAAASGAGGVPISIGLDAAPNTFIFAWSDDSLTFGDNGAIGLSPHGANRYGIKGRITKGASGIVPLPAGMSRASIVLIHAVIMSISLVLLPPIAIFIAMYLREKLGSTWLSVHVGIMVGGVGLLSIIGAVIAFLFKPGPHFASLHQIAGMAIIVLILLQTAFGFVAKAGYNPTASAPTIMTQVHRYFGFFLYAIMIPVQIYLGFSEYKTALGTAAPMYLIAVPAVFGLLGVGMLVAGYFVLPYGDSSFGGKARLGGINTFPIKGMQREFMPLEETMSPTSPNGYGGILGATRGGSRTGRVDAYPETSGVSQSGSRSGHDYVGASGMNRNGSRAVRAGAEEYVAGVNRNGSRGGHSMADGNSHGGMNGESWNSSRGAHRLIDEYYSGSATHQPQHSGNGRYGGSQQHNQGGSKYNDHHAQQQQQQQVQSGRDYPRSPVTHTAEYEYKPRSGNSRNAAGGGAGGSANGREYMGSRARAPQSQSRTRAGDEY
ncbi:hypothetical protein HDU78_003350 [Chytriomyces hyalinus]|nr:hypothetical protein HDU78_003350 [Chytriomyces hyalinus]